MTFLPYSYAAAALVNAKPLPSQVAADKPANTVSDVQSPSTERLAAIDNLRKAFGALPQAEQDSHVGTMTALGLRGEAAIGYIENLMTSSAVGQGFANAQAIYQQGFAAGSHTLNPENTAQLEGQARTTAAILVDRGATDPQIIQAVGNIPGVNLETLPTVLAAAQQVVDADKFNPFSSRNADAGINAPSADVATIETASLNPSLQNVLTAHLGKRQELDDKLNRENNWRAPVGPIPSVAYSAAAEALGNGYEQLGGLTPTDGLPKLAALTTGLKLG